MATNTYDCLLILDSSRYSRDPSGTADQIAKLIEGQGGKLLLSRLWEDRRLAYPINGHRKGAYWQTFFKLDSLNVAKLERDFQLNETVLRSLILKVDARIADDLVGHYSAAASQPRAEGRPAREERAPAAVDLEGDSLEG